MTPTLLRETAVVYRCPFCRRSWRSQGKRRAERHLTHCFKRPDRVPYLGELHAWWHDPVREWEPDIGTIWDGKAWRQVPGCRIECMPDPDHAQAGECFVGEWPELTGIRLDTVTPWVLRLELFDDICLNGLRHEDDRGELAPLRRRIDDAAVIRAIHGSAA